VGAPRLAFAIEHGTPSWQQNSRAIPSFTNAPPERLLVMRKRDQARSTGEILARVRNLEQICIMGSPEDQMKRTPQIDERILDLRRILETRAQNAGLNAEEAPEDYLTAETPRWNSEPVWKMRFDAASPERRCELVELATALSIARLSTLPASKQICKFQDFICDDSKEKLFQRDLRRLQWELRYLSSIDEKDLPQRPETCRKNLIEAKLRLSFAAPKESDTAHRWPLGRAIGMCARPMSAHYLDKDFIDGKSSAPEAWSHKTQLGWNQILDVEELGLRSD